MYRALSWFIDCPKDSSVDWNIDNAGAAGEGIISVKVNILFQGQFIYHDNAIYISNYSFYFIDDWRK
jgi:hypothetical protein